MGIPLEGQSLVLTGRFADVDGEDARWALIAKGARVMTSVTKSTSALIAGQGAEAKLLAQAAKHHVQVLGEDALRALMDGATLAAAAAHASPGRTAAPLVGRSVVVVGAPRRGTQAALAARLTQLGAEISKKVSERTTLLVLCSPTKDGLDAIQKGIDVLREDEVDALETGTALTAFFGRRDVSAPDPDAFIASQIAALGAELRAIDTAGERWDDAITLTIMPNGRVSVSLRALDGTPAEDHVRRVLQRADWPRVVATRTVKVPIVFG